MLLTLVLGVTGCTTVAASTNRDLENYALDYGTPTDPVLQARLKTIEAGLRTKLGMKTEEAAVGLLDLKTLRLAMIHPDRIEYAASVPKIGILLAWFQLHPEAGTNLNVQTRHGPGGSGRSNHPQVGNVAELAARRGSRHWTGPALHPRCTDAASEGRRISGGACASRG